MTGVVVDLKTAKLVPTVDECREQLERIQRSTVFKASDRGKRFLRYIVQETLAGRSERIKAYSIALEVFGRESTFDPQTDPIVRIEAGHLRRSLEHYYLTEGASDPVIINVPKGGYVPSFTLREPHDSVHTTPIVPDSGRSLTRYTWRRPLWLAGLTLAVVLTAVVLLVTWQMRPEIPVTPEVPRILITKFEDLSATANSAGIASGLTHEVVSQLSMFKDVILVHSVQSESLIAEPTARFHLAGTVELTAESFRLRVRFLNREDNSVLWARSYDGPLKPSEVVQAETDVARNIATTLAQSYGIIFHADLGRGSASPPDDWAAYACTLSYYAYLAGEERTSLNGVRTCLEKAVERYPRYSTAWALLAQIHIDEVRFKFPYDPSAAPAAIERALSTARHAVNMDPQNTRALQAEMFALFFGKEFEAGKSVGDRALAINPNDTELMGEYGYRLALSGSWPRGCQLMKEARDRNPLFGYYETGLALCQYFAGNSQAAVSWVKKRTYPKNAMYHLIAAALLGEAGFRAEAKRELEWLCKNRPYLIDNVRQELNVRLGKPSDVAKFLGSLEKGGMAPDKKC